MQKVNVKISSYYILNNLIGREEWNFVCGKFLRKLLRCNFLGSFHWVNYVFIYSSDGGSRKKKAARVWLSRGKGKFCYSSVMWEVY